jgi:hypothetical protein
MPLQPVPSPPRPLESWKEIAGYLNVTVRTAQRWRDAGLPVRYLGSGPRARVVAYSNELDAWVRQGKYQSASPVTAVWLVPRNRGGRLVLTGILAVLAVVAAFVVFYRPTSLLDRHPDHAVVEGHQLTVYDRQNHLCWRHQISDLDPDAYDPQSNLAHTNYIPSIPSLIDDIDGDGRREVLFNYWPVAFREVPGKLMCFEEDGKVRWQFQFGRERTFGDRHFSAVYQGMLVRSVRAHGKRWVLSVSHHDIWFPSQAALLDPKTGQIHQEYWHPGWIFFSNSHDLDEDQSEEIILAGVNNPGPGLGHAALAILKIAKTRQPLVPDHVAADIRAFTGGGELAYLLFPRSEFNTLQGVVPHIDTLAIVDGGHILIRTAGSDSTDILYQFDFSLRLTEFRLSDSFVPVHEQWRRKGLLDHALTQKEIADLRKVVVFPTAPDGNSADVARLWSLP